MKASALDIQELQTLNCLPYSLLPPGDVPDDITQEIRIITKLQNCTKGQKDFIEKYTWEK